MQVRHRFVCKRFSSLVPISFVCCYAHGLHGLRLAKADNKRRAWPWNRRVSNKFQVPAFNFLGLRSLPNCHDLRLHHTEDNLKAVTP